MSRLAFFGLFAVTAALVFYSLEMRSPWFVLAFAALCDMGSLHSLVQRHIRHQMVCTCEAQIFPSRLTGGTPGTTSSAGLRSSGHMQRPIDSVYTLRYN
jgi:hypothetical protein